MNVSTCPAHLQVSGPQRDLHSGNDGGVFCEPMMDLVKITSTFLTPGKTSIRVSGSVVNAAYVREFCLYSSGRCSSTCVVMCKRENDLFELAHAPSLMPTFYKITHTHTHANKKTQIPGFYDAVAPGLIDFAWDSLEQQGCQEFSRIQYQQVRRIVANTVAGKNSCKLFPQRHQEALSSIIFLRPCQSR